ncbi:unnamed protein product, partial [Closterium sp. NIES-53]
HAGSSAAPERGRVGAHFPGRHSLAGWRAHRCSHAQRRGMAGSAVHCAAPHHSSGACRHAPCAS